MKNFNKMSRGEQAYAMNEVVVALDDENAYYSGWLMLWPDGASLEEAKDYFDDCSDEEWKDFVQLFRSIVERYGCVDGRSIQEDEVDGLRVPNIQNPECEADERGGGFYFRLLKNDDRKTMARVAAVREALTAFGYPLTENEDRNGYVLFYVDWKKWRAQKAADFIRDSVEWLLQQDCGCCTIRLTAATQLAVGWENGFDPEDPSVIHSKSEPTWGICVGIKALDGDDLKTDFEYLTSPYVAEGEDEGTVFDLSVTPSENDDYESDFERLISAYRHVLKLYTVRKDGRAFRKE